MKAKKGLSHVLPAHMTGQEQAADTRADERLGSRNGDTPHPLKTGVGTFSVRVPPVREGQFSTECFAHSQREQPGSGPGFDGNVQEQGE